MENIVGAAACFRKQKVTPQKVRERNSKISGHQTQDGTLIPKELFRFTEGFGSSYKKARAVLMRSASLSKQRIVVFEPHAFPGAIKIPEMV